MKIEEVFKRYDIRGSYPSEINEDFALILGLATASYIENNNLKRSIVIGNDLRDSSPKLKNAFIKALQSKNIFVYDIGVATTDVVAKITPLFADIGVMITASHNELTDNGFKYVYDEGLPFTNEMLNNIKEKVYQILDQKNIMNIKNEILSKKYPPYETPYKVINNEAYKNYNENIIKTTNIAQLKTLLPNTLFHTQNSAATLVLESLRRNHLPEINLNYESYDINYTLPSEPTEDYLLNISNGTYEINITFDPDADRVLIADKKYKHHYIPGQYLLYGIISAYSPENAVVSIDFSEKLAAQLKNTKLIKTKVGDVFVSNKAKEVNAEIFGEPNNHIGFNAHTYYHSGIYAALKYLEKRKEILELLNKAPQLFFKEIRIDASEQQYEELLEKVSQNYETISKLDGIKIKIDKGYVLIRYSGTSNKIKIIIEADSEKDTEKIKSQILELIKN